MNEQLQKALADLIGKLVSAVDTAQGMLPELVQQMVNWQITKDYLWVTLGVFLLVVGVICALLLLASDEKDVGGIIFFMICIAIAGVWTIFYNGLELVQLYNYPQTWIIEYLRGISH